MFSILFPEVIMGTGYLNAESRGQAQVAPRSARRLRGAADVGSGNYMC
jgi:hypothetical protein